MINMTPKFKVGDMVRWRREIVFADGSVLAGGDVANWGSNPSPWGSNGDTVVYGDDVANWGSNGDTEVLGFILSHKQVWYRDSDPESLWLGEGEKTIIWYEVHWGHKGTTMAAEIALEKL